MDSHAGSAADCVSRGSGSVSKKFDEISIQRVRIDKRVWVVLLISQTGPASQFVWETRQAGCGLWETVDFGGGEQVSLGLNRALLY